LIEEPMNVPRFPSPAAAPTRRRVLATVAAAAAATLLAACGGGSGSTSQTSAAGAATGSAGAASAAAPTTAVRIGYFPNVTHAPGLVADAEGFFTKRIGDGKVTTQSFNAGPDVVQAILGGSLDISYIGPNPTITAYAQSKGDAVRVISGSTSGGASLVVKQGITSAAQLKGKKIATPQLGNTQDVALRYWLTTQNLKSDTEGGGDVSIIPQKNAATVTAFGAGQIDGAWVPEPFATQLVAAGGTVLVDEKSLWPDGKFVTTNIIVRKEFLEKNPATVRAFLDAHLDALDLIAKDPAKAQSDVAAQIKKITEQEPKASTLAAAWKNLAFTADPLQSTLKESAKHAETVGLLKDKPSDDFAQLWDLTLLNAALKDRGQPEVSPL
jgi:NitT/TauT family transport system substrate-binding protein